MPHTADEAWLALHGPTAQSVHLQMFDSPDCTAEPIWDEVMSNRVKALKALEVAKESGIENPLDAGLLLPTSLAGIDPCDLADLCGVSRVHCQGDTVAVQDLRNEPRCDRSWKRDGTVALRSDGGMLSDRDAKAVGVE